MSPKQVLNICLVTIVFSFSSQMFFQSGRTKESQTLYRLYRSANLLLSIFLYIVKCVDAKILILNEFKVQCLWHSN